MKSTTKFLPIYHKTFVIIQEEFKTPKDKSRKDLNRQLFINLQNTEYRKRKVTREKPKSHRKINQLDDSRSINNSCRSWEDKE